MCARSILYQSRPDPVFADIENFRPRDRLRARDRSRTFGTAVNNAAR
jgi:hypothetical protein